MSLKDDMKLDVHEIDAAALQLPTLFAHWGELWAKAVEERDSLKQQISAKKAELYEKVRESPENYGYSGDKKPGENWVISIVDFHKEVVELENKLPTLQYEVNMMQIAKDACESQSRSLHILTELYKGNYFAASSRGTITHSTAIENSYDKQRESISNHPRLKKKV
jgi:hypothetical protein